MLKIRLMRIGSKKRPFYRVVAVDERKKRTGGYIELLGTYNPLTNPKEINLKQDRIDHWTKLGAQPSEGFLRIIGKAPQRPPRKPKKQQPEPKPAPAAAAEEKAVETSDEAPQENVTQESTGPQAEAEPANHQPAQDESGDEHPKADTSEPA